MDLLKHLFISDYNKILQNKIQNLQENVINI